jgi:hypothetical protein
LGVDVDVDPAPCGIKPGDHGVSPGAQAIRRGHYPRHWRAQVASAAGEVVASRARRQTENRRQGGDAGGERALPSDFRARDSCRIAGKAEGANRECAFRSANSRDFANPGRVVRQKHRISHLPKS